MFAALENATGALGTFPHSAAVAKIGIGKLLDARHHDEVGVILDLAAMGFAVAMENDDRHVVQAAFGACSIASSSASGMSLAT